MRVVLTGNFGKEIQEKRKSNLSQNTILKHVESISLIYATLLDNRKSGIYIITSLISQLFQIMMINNHNNNNKKQTKGTKLKRNFEQFAASYSVSSPELPSLCRCSSCASPESSSSSCPTLLSLSTIQKTSVNFLKHEHSIESVTS